MALKKNSQEHREIGGRIRTLRKRQKMKQQTLADLIGVPSRSTISDIERGQRRAAAPVLKAIAQVFGVTVTALVGDARTPDTPDAWLLRYALLEKLHRLDACQADLSRTIQSARVLLHDPTISRNT